MAMRLGVAVSALAVMFALVGCAATFHASYDTTTVRRAQNPRIDVVLDLEALRDARRGYGPSALLFRGDREVKIGGEAACVNAEAHYKGDVARQVTQTVAAHMRRRGVLRAVTVGNPVQAHYRLNGELGALYGVQEPSSEAAVGMAFGLIGALATLGVTTPGRVRIVFQNLVIRDSAGRVVARPEDVVLDVRGELPADGYCWRIYENVNDKLREAVGTLASAVEWALRGTESTGIAAPVALAAALPRQPTAAELQAREEQRRARREAFREQELSKWEAERRTWNEETVATKGARTPLTTAAFITAGVGAALVGTGIFFTIKATEADDEARSAAALWGTTVTDAERAQLQNRFAESQSDRDTYNALGTSFLVGGGASLAASLVLLIVRPGFPAEPIRPAVDGNGLGITIRGSI